MEANVFYWPYLLDSYSDSQNDSLRNSFKFTYSTPVYMYFNPKDLRLTFRNGRTNKSFSLSVKPNGMDLYACVELDNKSHEVEIIQPQDIPDLE